MTKMIGPDYWMKNPGITAKGDRKEFIDPDLIPWTNWLMPGTQFKLFSCNLATGAFTFLLNVDPGTKATPHWHVANLEVLILKGGFYYEEDDQGHAGYYTCETAGTVHEPFAPEGCLMFVISQGPIGGYTDDGQLAVVADAHLHLKLAQANDAAALTRVIDYTVS
ncbi:2,4'-dihydroxyacetophenone dioxygenase family protein [Amaricoccus sp.]|uniref:2,4'-dihydroxyacetophenone dioxygenase family protein n=1 Tax=Amaricoccus sp. TaxID=1872485 RepID=UPI00262A4E18|nr:2,4'-dihydroxyacetophenone dioxygenase family protein [uncultured Amaricoccus sp.]